MAVWLLVCAPAYAWQKADSSKVKVNLSLNGNISEGNANRWILINRASLNWKPGNGKIEIEHSDYYLYGKVQGNRFENNILDRTIISLHSSPKIKPFAALFLESYPVRNQDFRWQAGAGLKYTLYQKKGWFIEPALMLSYSKQQFFTANFKDFDNGGSNELETSYLTPVVNIQMPLFAGKLILSHHFWAQLDLSGDGNNRLYYDGKVLMKLNKAFGLQLIINNYWEQLVQAARGTGSQGPSITHNDLIVAYGVTFNMAK